MDPTKAFPLQGEAGCSALAWHTQDGRRLWGRNYDFDRLAQGSGMTFLPRGTVYAPAPGPLQGKGVGVAGDDRHDLPVGQGSRRLGIEQRLQIGASAGDQHRDAGLVQHRTTRSSPGTISPIT